MKQLAPNIKNDSAKKFCERIDLYRLDASRQLSPTSKSDYGQFMTPSTIASFMSSLFSNNYPTDITLLDAGAGIGSLSTAFVADFCSRKKHPGSIHVTAFEIDTFLFNYLDTVLSDCQDLSKYNNIKLSTDVIKEDFVQFAVSQVSNKLFSKEKNISFTHAILNPPYKKIHSESKHRSLLSSIGIEVSNLYAAFIALAIQLLEPSGELVAITPRSFCNGPYFRKFRKLLLEETSLKHIHVFESRVETFSEEQVLQENIIIHCIKNKKRNSVCITNSYGLDFENLGERNTIYSEIVNPEDSDSFIRIATNEIDRHVLDRINCFSHKLQDIGLEVSTGGLVDFRAKSLLLSKPQNKSFPLIYPMHFYNGYIKWPLLDSKKPNAVLFNESIKKYLLPAGDYVLTKRFSPKEQQRRISAVIYTSESTQAEYVAFENHLNVFHSNKNSMPSDLAKGLYVYLSSSIVDIYFRQFNGHTQVNATDLRSLKYPSRKQLEKMGRFAKKFPPSQEIIDELIENEVHKMANISSPNPVLAKKKTEEALLILKALGFPKAQQNDRSALTLLALLNLKPNSKWSKAKSTLIGITPIMDFCTKYYGRKYAPNTRETFRRQTMHQFVAAGLVIENPDCPTRPINSPKWCYLIEENSLALLKKFGSKSWKINIEKYLSKIKTLAQRYAKERKMLMIPVKLIDGNEIKLSPGKHNELIKAIIEDFAPRFAPGAKVIYVGDTAKKWGYFDKRSLKGLGISIDSHGKMPDVVLYYSKKDWLLLIEAVTSHGPVDSKRRQELCKLFDSALDKIIFVTAFPTRSEIASYLNEISWETEVWVAENPTHLIHFNGERFLGPYNHIT